ncbi:glycosyltransferase family 2 protein [Aurantivibrio plasticivorans]
MPPLVSILMPCRNSERWIRQSILSVLEQSYSNFELIVVDDGSIDETKSIVQRFLNRDPRIVFISYKSPMGAAHARNLGLEKASGRFIAFLDSDDLWDPEKLQIQVDFMLDNDCKFSYTAYSRIKDDNTFINLVEVPKELTKQDLLKTCYIGCLTAMYDTHYFGKVYMENIKRRQDYALWLKLLSDLPYAHGITHPLAKYRVHNLSLSSSKIRASYYSWVVYRKIERLSFLKSLYYFAHYSVKGVFRHHIIKHIPSLNTE